jgi:hypothetical protein
MRDIISALIPYDVDSPKIRLGHNQDGGYIVNDLLLTNASKLITFGYGNEDTFEIDWYEKTNTPIDIYDGTCVCGTICHKYPQLLGSTLNYHQRNVGNAHGNIPVSDILRSTHRALLKIDIEGAEYSALDAIDFSNQAGVLLEFHDLHYTHNREKLVSLLSNELQSFVLFHIHANNWTGTFDLNGVQFPQTIEISMIHEVLVSRKSIDTAVYPIYKLDYPNNNTQPEIIIPR